MQNTAASNAATQANVTQARANGQYLQNQDNAQVTQDQGQYNNAVNSANTQLGQANQAGQNLANFNGLLVGINCPGVDIPQASFLLTHAC